MKKGRGGCPFMNLRPTSMSSSTVSALRKCGMWGIDIATATTSYGFQAAKTGTKLGFSITRGIASAVIGVTSPIVDLAFFDNSGMSSLVIGGAVATAITFAEQLTLAPLNIGEYITSGSLLAAHSSINVLSVIFPGSSEASFSLASFITLVKREWNDPEFATNLPDRKFGLTEIARAVVAWVALQGVTQEWQEQVWLKSLKEIKVEDHPIETIRRQRVGSRVRVTSDIIFPGNLGQLISADIGEAPVPYARAMSHTPLPKGPGCTSSSAATSRRPRVEQLKPKNPTEMKATLRRLSKIVLAGYGGASMWFFGVGPDFTSSPVTPFASGPANKKTSEEAQLENAIDASEAEAFGNTPNAPSPTPSPGTQNPNTYSWWDMLLGKHDQEIFEHYANAPVEQQTQQARHAQETWRRKKAQMKTETVHGMEHQMPRFWVLTDHGRSQIVLVLRGTMSLNELAVDLTCEPVEFDPAGTSYQEEDDVSERPSTLMPSHFPFPTTPSFRRFPRQSMASISSISSLSQPRYLVHSGMLKMARMMGEAGKPVHRAVQDALHKNADYELLLCGHSLGAGVGAVLGLMWADPKTCRTVRSSGLPIGRRVSVYCFAPPCLVDPALSVLASNLITSLVYSHDVVSRLSLGSVKDIRNAAMWLCDANDEEQGYASVTRRARAWKAGGGLFGAPDWFIAVRKTLEANMHMTDLFPPGRVLWALRDSDLHPSHRLSTPQTHHQEKSLKSSTKTEEIEGKDKLRLFEVLDVEKVFSQIVFAKDMLSAHMPHQYDRVLDDLL